MPLVGRPVQGGVAHRILNPGVRARIEQHAHSFDMAALRCHDERGRRADDVLIRVAVRTRRQARLVALP